MDNGVAIPKEALEKLLKLDTLPIDIQKVVGFTEFIQQKISRGAFFGPLDREPASVLEGPDPTNLSFDGTVDLPMYTVSPPGALVKLAEYTVPLGRCAFVLPTSTSVVTNALVAGQRLATFGQINRHSGRKTIVQVIATGPTSAGQAVVYWVDQGDVVQVFSYLSNGAGAVKVIGWIAGMEYNK